tara:strand:- start:4063 stop:4197 length:135 start_codon:yes stop_codon:yes gene_type:complete
MEIAMSLYELLEEFVAADEAAHETADELEQDLVDFIDDLWSHDH